MSALGLTFLYGNHIEGLAYVPLPCPAHSTHLHNDGGIHIRLSEWAVSPSEPQFALWKAGLMVTSPLLGHWVKDADELEDLV